MTLETRELNIPLNKRRWSWLWFVASFALAVLIIRPSLPAQWLVTVGIVAPTVWLVFIGPYWLYYWQLNHRYSFVGWAVMAIRLALFFFVVWYVVPRASLLVGEWLHG